MDISRQMKDWGMGEAVTGRRKFVLYLSKAQGVGMEVWTTFLYRSMISPIQFRRNVATCLS